MKSKSSEGKGIKLNPSGGNDKVYTPDYLARYIIDYFKPTGKIVEPSSGKGV